MRHVRRSFGAALAAVVAMALVVSGAPPAAAATPVVTVTMETNPLTRPEPGGDFTYTVRVTNGGTEAVRITALNDTVYGNLLTRPGSSCGVVGPFVDPGAQVACNFTASFAGGAGATLTNTVTAAVITTAPSAETAIASGTATITITDAPPAIQVTYTASPVAQPTPGGTFTFTVVVRNVGVEAVTVTGVADNVYGGLATRPGSTCGALVGTTLAPGATSAACTFTGTFTGPAGARQTSIVTVTAVDDEGSTAVDDDAATVFLSTIISIRVDHSASPSSRPEPGGTFTFTEVITNTSAESLGIVALTDSVYGDLFARPGSTCGSLDHHLLGPGASIPCTFTGEVFGGAGLTQTSVVTVVAEDQEGRKATDTDDAAVAITGVPGGSRYVPLSPARIEDTRTGAGGISGALGPGATVAVQVGGRGGVPAEASAVVMNVTVTQPTAEGFLILYPDGGERPLAANVNFTPGKTVPNLAVVKLGPAAGWPC